MKDYRLEVLESIEGSAFRIVSDSELTESVIEEGMRAGGMGFGIRAQGSAALPLPTSSGGNNTGAVGDRYGTGDVAVGAGQLRDQELQLQQQQRHQQQTLTTVDTTLRTPTDCPGNGERYGTIPNRDCAENIRTGSTVSPKMWKGGFVRIAFLQNCLS